MSTRVESATPLVLDGFAPPGLLARCAGAWPAADWPWWHHYEGAQGGKRGGKPAGPLPAVFGELLWQMARLDVESWFGAGPLLPDLGLWGAGLHEMLPGSRLPAHLDAALHPRLRLGRVLSACLYLHERWELGWGGELALGGGEGAAVLAPLPGRLVAFDSRGLLHWVRPVAPGARPRRSLALFWYGPPAEGGGGARTRAHFPGMA